MNKDSDSRDPVARAASLVRIFSGAAEFGVLRSVAASQVPEPARSLLDHCSHMTVAMERHHGCDVRLRVVAQADGDHRPDSGPGSEPRRNEGWYAREILLETPAGKIVLYGIVRIDLTNLDAATARAIREARRPLGRILIEAGMLREVHGVKLLEIQPGWHLREVLRLPPLPAAGGAATAPVAASIYGRVADIQLDGRPAVELLEIVPPSA